MRIVVGLALIAATLCAHAEEERVPLLAVEPTAPEVSPTIAGGGSCEPMARESAPQVPELVLRKANPKSGSVVSRATAVVASLEYAIPDYVEGQFKLIAQFETKDPALTFNGAFPKGGNPLACGPAGIFSVYFPLEYVWDVPIIKRPFRMVFYLLQRTGQNARPVAASEWIEYPPIDSP